MIHSQKKKKQTDTEGELYNYADTEGKSIDTHKGEMIYSLTKRKRYRHSQRKTEQTDTEGELYNYADTKGK